jgi:hypothetical protein
MTRKRCTSPAPLPSSTRRSRRSIHNKDLDDDLSTIPDNYNDHQDDSSESDDEPVWRPFRQAMVKQPSKVSSKSTLVKRVAATQLPPAYAQPLYPERRVVHIVPEEEDTR